MMKFDLSVYSARLKMRFIAIERFEGLTSTLENISGGVLYDQAGNTIIQS